MRSGAQLPSSLGADSRHLQRNEGMDPATPANGLDRRDWWVVYHDPILNRLEEQVQLSNQNIKESEAAYREARSGSSRTTQSALFPSATVTPSVEHLKSGKAPPTNTYTLSGSVTSISTSGGRSAATLRTAWRIRHRTALRRILNCRRAENHKPLRLSGPRFFAAVAERNRRKLFSDHCRSSRTSTQREPRARSDVITAQAQLLSTQAAAVNVAVQRATFEHAIAMLTGRPPADPFAQIARCGGAANSCGRPFDFAPAAPRYCGGGTTDAARERLDRGEHRGLLSRHQFVSGVRL